MPSQPAYGCPVDVPVSVAAAAGAGGGPEGK